jgi:nucleotide-binding universal stress UspA family protein
MMGAIRTILCPTDLSEASGAALDFALSLAHLVHAEVVLLHVMVEPPRVAEGYQLDRFQRAATDEAQRCMADLMTKAADWKVKTVPRIRRGVEFREINAAAVEEKADLIVMGTHGRTGLEHFLIGSVAEKVVRTSPCPVLTVRPPEARR